MQELKPKAKRGQFIVLYGANNLGKSVQIRELASKMIQEGHMVMTNKYPIYNLGKTGPKIDKILRRPHTLKKTYSELELQKLFAKNRSEFQPTLINILNSNINVIAEDYKGTGIAWGMTRDIDLVTMQDINSNLIDPDISIVLDGERFISGIEKSHRYEAALDKVWEKSRKIHQELAKLYGWTTVNANQTITQVHSKIWKIVKPQI